MKPKNGIHGHADTHTGRVLFQRVEGQNSQQRGKSDPKQCETQPFIIDLYVFAWLRGPDGFLVVQMVKNLPIKQETHVQFLGQEDPLKEGMAAHSSILAWRIPWTEEPGGLQSMGSHRVGHN